MRIWLLILVLVLTAKSARAADVSRRWEDEVVYVVITEKFQNGDPNNDFMARRYGRDRNKFEGGFWGGDLAGVTQRLDDLADLGITAILIYPVMQNDKHPAGKYLATGYRPSDLFRVDENFGDMDALKTLVRAAHARKIKVILDLPLGFPGFEYSFLADPAKQDWFGSPTQYGTRRWNTDNPKVADYLIAASKFWKLRSHCDGFRLDSIQIHPNAFWKRYADEIKTAPPAGDFWLLGEDAVSPKAIGEFLRETHFDSAYDFSVLKVQGVLGKGEDVSKLAFIRRARASFPSPQSMTAQIDNYEAPAFVEAAKEPKLARMKEAMTFLLTLDRIPLIYPGDELAKHVTSPGDAFPSNRREIPFYRYVRALIELRKREPALRRGDFREIESSQPIYAYERQLNATRFLIILNNADESRFVQFPIGETKWREARLEDALLGRLEKAPGEDRAIQIGPLEAKIFRVQ